VAAVIDHLGIAVHDHEASKRFYTAALAPLNIGVMMEVPKSVSGASSDYTGFGSNDKPYSGLEKGQSRRRCICVSPRILGRKSMRFTRQR
jgi:hypothetical protein